MFSDLSLSFFILLLFIVLFGIDYFAIGFKKIKEEWPKYKCNPVVMPFAGTLGYDTNANFISCIGNIQKDLMGFFLQPVHYILSLTGNLGINLMGSLQNLRYMFSNIRNFLSNMITGIFSIFTNVIIQIQKFISNLKDLMSKQVAVVVTLMYMTLGASMTGRSIMAGPIGETLRFLCFHPNTPLVLKNGKRVFMKNINLGDTLENNSEVIAILKIKNAFNDPFYKIWDDKIKHNIYVTGSHKILHNNTFIEVQNHPEAKKTSIVNDTFSCLITNDHLIPIGEKVFWDWED
jgi:hypothetical protein